MSTRPTNWQKKYWRETRRAEKAEARVVELEGHVESLLLMVEEDPEAHDPSTDCFVAVVSARRCLHKDEWRSPSDQLGDYNKTHHCSRGGIHDGPCGPRCFPASPSANEAQKPWDGTKTYQQNLDEGRHWDPQGERPSEARDDLDVQCPRCLARPMQYCTNPKGMVLEQAHGERVHAPRTNEALIPTRDGKKHHIDCGLFKGEVCSCLGERTDCAHGIAADHEDADGNTPCLRTDYPRSETDERRWLNEIAREIPSVYGGGNMAMMVRQMASDLRARDEEIRVLGERLTTVERTETTLPDPWVLAQACWDAVPFGCDGQASLEAIHDVLKAALTGSEEPR